MCIKLYKFNRVLYFSFRTPFHVNTFPKFFFRWRSKGIFANFSFFTPHHNRFPPRSISIKMKVTTATITSDLMCASREMKQYFCRRYVNLRIYIFFLMPSRKYISLGLSHRGSISSWDFLLLCYQIYYRLSSIYLRMIN